MLVVGRRGVSGSQAINNKAFNIIGYIDKYMSLNKKYLLESEKRFKRVCNISTDISTYPLKNNVSNVETNKSKSKEFSEVFTPLWLVDEMINQVRFSSGWNVKTLDLCAGYGQFTIRLMRYFFNHYKSFDIKKFLCENHAFSELQLSSCYKLLNTFSDKINLFIGDSTHLNKLPKNASGIWCYIESFGYWVCLTKTIQKILSPNGLRAKSISEEEFVQSVGTIIQNLNESYTIMYNVTFEQMTKSSKSRLALIDQANSLITDDKGNAIVKMIPSDLISDMLGNVEDLEKKCILVLFNCEIVEQLIYKKKIDPKNITFGVDHKATMKSSLMKKMYGVNTILFGEEPRFIAAAFKGKKFDVCFSNPPYNDHIHLKILMALFNVELAKEYVVVHPANWLIDQKKSLPLFTNFKSMVAKTLKSVNLFNGNTVFGIGLFYPCVITHIDNNHYGEIKVKYFDDSYSVSDIGRITKYGKNWDTIVAPLVSKLNKTIKSNGSVWSKNVSRAQSNLQYCQIAAIRGNVGKNGSLFEDDFYTMIMKNSDDNKGIRKAMDKRPGPTFEFASTIERDNFINYLKTDFARFCLSIYKNSANLFYGEMDMIPWLDFTQVWDDEKLFNHFDINKETQDYIRKFLPDYYGIRKTNGNAA
jgi:hypothetical protein